MAPAAHLPDADRLFDHAPCGLLLADPNGVIRRVNATFCSWIGLDAAAMVNQRRFQDLFTMGGRVFYQTHLAPLLQMQGSVAEVTLDLRHSDGHPLPVMFNIARRSHGGQEFDEIAVFVATDRRKYEHELLLARKNAEASLKALAEAQQALERDATILADQSDAIVVVDAQGAVIDANAATLRMLGYGRQELLGLPLSRFYPGPVADQVMAALAGVLGDAREWRGELTFFNKEGEKGFSESVLKPLLGRDGKPYGAVSVSRDITARERDAARLRELNAQLALADRKKDEFLATLAHELRNPLAPLANVLEILKLKASADPQLIRARDVFARQMDQLSHLVDDLMDISRITQGRIELRRQAISLADVMRGAVEATQTQIAARGHRLEMALPQQPVTLDADSTRLTQILTNLLNNAAKYTPDGGHIWFSAHTEGGEVRISVRDSGIGIAADHLESVFFMFAQLEPALGRAQGGLGIGLALVKGLVELHGGSIGAHSNGVGQGSEFVVRLPVLSGAQVEQVEQTCGPAPVQPLSQVRRILVVDDNRDSADMLRMALDMLGYEVACAYDGADALQLASTLIPDAIVLDIGLPGMDGYEVARRIRGQPWGARVTLVAATGWGQQRDRDAAQAAGFDHHMVKPVDFHQLDAVLRAGLRGASPCGRIDVEVGMIER